MKKQLLVSVDRGETRVALMEATGTPDSAEAKPTTRGRGRTKKVELAEGYRVAELYFERRGNRSIVGNIYKGKVDNVLPGLEAAFEVELGDAPVLLGSTRRGLGLGGRPGRFEQRNAGFPAVDADEHLLLHVVIPCVQ